MTDNGIADVVVVGGGAMGSAVAYFLGLLGRSTLRVVVCEQDASYASSATLQAAGGIRQTFALPENIEVSRFGAAFLRGAPDTLAVGDDRPDLGIHPRPYLYLVSGDDETRRLSDVERLRAAAQVPATLLDRGLLAGRFPWLNVDDLDAGLLGGDDEGVFDPEALLRALKRKAVALGVIYREAKVVGFDLAAGRIASVRLSTGDAIRCATVINAAGPGAANVAALAGCLLPIEPRPATTFVFQSPAPLAGMPVVVDRVLGLHVRPEGDRFLASLTRAPAAREGEGSDDPFTDRLWPALAHRIPAFEAIRFAGMWPGVVDASPVDGNPMIGPDPVVGNLIMLAGFNGHGLQHAPAAGRGVAEFILHGAYRSIDFARFGPGRMARPPAAVEYF